MIDFERQSAPLLDDAKTLLGQQDLGKRDRFDLGTLSVTAQQRWLGRVFTVSVREPSPYDGPKLEQLYPARRLMVRTRLGRAPEVTEGQVIEVLSARIPGAFEEWFGVPTPRREKITIWDRMMQPVRQPRYDASLKKCFPNPGIDIASYADQVHTARRMNAA